MITDKDVQKLKEVFATKDDLKAFATKDEVKELKEVIISFKDEILHEIKGLREEVTLVTGYKDDIENHDYRLDRIEKHVGLPPIE